MKEIKLTQDKITLVDDEDYDLLNQWKWFAHKQKNGTFRAIRGIKENGKKKFIIMSRLIMNANADERVDHKDHDELNNQKSNLRICTHHQNNFNKRSHRNSTSKYLGVCFDKENNKWLASITYNYKHITLGRFLDETHAARAYNKKAKELFGEFANLNEIK